MVTPNINSPRAFAREFPDVPEGSQLTVATPEGLDVPKNVPPGAVLTGLDASRGFQGLPAGAQLNIGDVRPEDFGLPPEAKLSDGTQAPPPTEDEKVQQAVESEQDPAVRAMILARARTSKAIREARMNRVEEGRETDVMLEAGINPVTGLKPDVPEDRFHVGNVLDTEWTKITPEQARNFYTQTLPFWARQRPEEFDRAIGFIPDRALMAFGGEDLLRTKEKHVLRRRLRDVEDSAEREEIVRFAIQKAKDDNDRKLANDLTEIAIEEKQRAAGTFNPLVLAAEAIAGDAAENKFSQTSQSLEQFRGEAKRQGPVGVFESLADMDPGEKAPFGGAALVGKKALQLMGALNKLDAGEELLDHERAMVIDALRAHDKAVRRGSSLGGMVASISSELPGFAIEFAATGGAASSGREAIKSSARRMLGDRINRALARQAALHAEKKALGAATRGAAAAQTAKRAAGAVGDLTTEAAIRTGLSPQRVFSSFAQRRLPSITPDEAQEFGLGIEQTDESFTESLVNAFADTGIEFVSEGSGALMTGAKKAILSRWFQKYPKTTPDTFFDAALKRLGYNGVIEEVLEERIGEGLRGLSGVQKYQAPTQKQLAAEIIAFSIPGGSRAMIRGLSQLPVGEMVSRIDRINRQTEEGEAAIAGAIAEEDGQDPETIRALMDSTSALPFSPAAILPPASTEEVTESGPAPDAIDLADPVAAEPAAIPLREDVATGEAVDMAPGKAVREQRVIPVAPEQPRPGRQDVEAALAAQTPIDRQGVQRAARPTQGPVPLARRTKAQAPATGIPFAEDATTGQPIDLEPGQAAPAQQQPEESIDTAFEQAQRDIEQDIDIRQPGPIPLAEPTFLEIEDALDSAIERSARPAAEIEDVPFNVSRETSQAAPAQQAAEAPVVAEGAAAGPGAGAQAAEGDGGVHQEAREAEAPQEVSEGDQGVDPKQLSPHDAVDPPSPGPPPKNRSLLEDEQGAFSFGDILRNFAASPARKWLKRNFTSAGDLPVDVFRRKIQRDGWTATQLKTVQFALKDLDSSVRKWKGRGRNLSDQEATAIDAILKGQAQNLGALPKAVAEAAQAMREHIDTLSRRMIDSGAVTGDLAMTVDRNMGVYLTRTYRVFEDPKWAKKVDPEVRNKAKQFILSRLRIPSRAKLEEMPLRQKRGSENSAPRETILRLAHRHGLIAKLRAEGKTATKENLIAALLERSQSADFDNMAELRINQILMNRADGPVAKIGGGKLGAKDLSITKRRKDIPPEIRALMGEIADPVENYARSVNKMANLIANQEFLGDVRAAGLGEFFFEPGDPDIPSTHHQQIAAEGSDVMAPLNGLFTTPEIKQAFEDALSPQNLPDWMSHYMKINSAVKYSKTVGSVMTHVRNVVGNTGFAVANGHWRIGNANDSFRTFNAAVGNQGTKEFRGFFLKLQELGLLNEGARAGELVDAIRDAGQQGMDQFSESRARRGLSRVLKFTTDLYQAEDDVWKIFAWKNEMDRYRNARPDLAEEDLEKLAAEIVRNTYPSYSLIPRGVKAMRRFPLAGTFVSFPAEVVRVSGNIMSLAASELKDPRTRAIGAQRLAGIVAAASLPTGAAIASMFMLGMDGEDDEYVRRHLPSWSENSTLIYFRRAGDGKIDYIDISYTDPFSYLKTPITALMRGDSWVDSVRRSGVEAAEPFLSEEILAGKLLDVTRNKDAESGREIFNPQDTWEGQASDVIAHVGEAITPGTIMQAHRIVKGIQGETNLYGRKYDPVLESVAVASGHRLSSLDVGQSLKFKSFRFQKDMKNAEDILRSVVTRAGGVSGPEIDHAISKSIRAQERLIKEFHDDIESAKRLGLNPGGIPQSLRGTGMSRAKVVEVMTGQKTGQAISTRVLNRMQRSIAQSIRDPEIRSQSLRMLADRRAKLLESMRKSQRSAQSR